MKAKNKFKCAICGKSVKISEGRWQKFKGCDMLHCKKCSDEVIEERRKLNISAEAVQIIIDGLKHNMIELKYETRKEENPSIRNYIIGNIEGKRFCVEILEEMLKMYERRIKENGKEDRRSQRNKD